MRKGERLAKVMILEEENFEIFNSQVSTSAHFSPEELDVGDKKLLFRVLESYFSILGNRPTGSAPDLPPQHSVELKTEAPVVCGSRHLTYSLRDEVAVKIKELLDQGVVRLSTSRFAAPIVPVRKTDNYLRLCIDYRRLNAVTIPISYPLPRIEDLTEKVNITTHITSQWLLDLLSPRNQKHLT